jgi:demethylmenaquinone methyltransferase/2-methoxy-6-polyprenyl-1,4-benzoquinol methylase
MALGALPPAEEKRTRVRAMFDRIAPRYDALNRLLTLGLDQRWRRIALAAAGVGPGDQVVDVGCGTGDLAALAAARGARVVGVDFSGEMLRAARRRGPASAWVRGDAEALPLPDAFASVVTSGFALRNFASLERALAEMARVLRPGGRLALLEVDRPDAAWVAGAHSLYFDRLVPRIGGWLSDAEAYRYLPESTAYLPPPAALAGLLGRLGLAVAPRRRFLLGTAQLVLARREALA